MTDRLEDPLLPRKPYSDVINGPDGSIIGLNITGNVDADKKAIEDILRERNMTLEDLLKSLQQTTIRTIQTGDSPPQSDDDTVSVGLVVPIVLIIVFLVCVFVCLYWHTWRDRSRQNDPSDKSINASIGRFTRSFNTRKGNTLDNVRESTRSTAPLHDSFGHMDKVHVTPLSFSDSQKFRFYWDKDNWKLYPHDNQPGPQVNTTRISMLRQQLSPIDEMEMTPHQTESLSLSQAYNLTAQAPFSPYHLTWLSPNRRNMSESEMSTISKPPRFSLQTTNTTVSTESCSACVKYGKSVSSPFYPHNNTPNTECTEQESSQSQVMKMQSELTANNSRFTSYPSSPRSSASPRSSVPNSLTTSNLDTGVDASLVTSYQEPLCPPSSLQSDLNPSADNSELNQSTNPISERQSQTESDFSGGVPSLPSSILYYHQKMAAPYSGVATGTIPFFSVSGMNCSMGSSLESSENNYVDNTSMLPNVGSSNTSGNPTGSIMFTSTMPASLEVSQPLVTEPTQNNTEDLSKIVNELSSIRVCSSEPFSAHPGTVSANFTEFDGTTLNSVFEGDERRMQPTGVTASEGNLRQSLTELFRSWSVTAELDFSSSSVELYQKDGQKQMSGQNLKTGDAKPMFDFNKFPSAGNRLSNDIPVLTDKIYWV